MKIWIIFILLIILIISLILGYFLSSNIIDISQLIVFWVLYIISVLTVFTILISVYIHYDIRNLKGERGEQGETGEQGEKGETGLCEKDCKLHIPYNIILFNIETHLYELENSEKKEEGYNEKLYNQILESITKSNSIKNLRELCKEIYLYKSIINDNSNRTELKNIYWKETIKRIVYSNQYKELEDYRGRDKLIEYMTYIFLVWISLIYKSVGKKYFQSIGAEEDFKFYGENPFNEIKKYDIFYWGLPNTAKPRKISVKPLFTKKVDVEGFSDYSTIKSTKQNDEEKNNVNEIKMIKSSDFVFSYDDRGTRIRNGISCFKLKPKTVQTDGKSEKYYPLGDVCVNTFGNGLGKNTGSTMSFGDYDNPSKKSVKTVGPNLDSVLVNGSCFSEPIDYKLEWVDRQKHSPIRHDCVFKCDKKHSHYRGKMFRPMCKQGSTPFGISVISTRNQDDNPEMKNYQDVDIEKPKLENGPRCVRNDCIDKVKSLELTNNKVKIWDTKNVPKHLRYAQASFYDYKRKSLFSLNRQTEENANTFKNAIHDNAYNLVSFDNYKYLKQDKITHSPSKISNLPTKVEVDDTNETLIESYKKQIKAKEELYKTKTDISEKKTLKDSINYYRNLIKGLKQDLGWPLITKLDKTGELNEASDKYTYYVSKIPEDRYLDRLNDGKVKIFIEKYNNLFISKNSLTEDEINNLVIEVDILINKLTKLECVHLISFMDSFPQKEKYKLIKDKREKINIKCEIEKQKNNEYSFGLGYVYDNKVNLDNPYQSLHNFYYLNVPEKGVIESKGFEFNYNKKLFTNRESLDFLYEDKNVYEINNRDIKFIVTDNNNGEFNLYDIENKKYLKVNENGELDISTGIEKDVFKLK